MINSLIHLISVFGDNGGWTAIAAVAALLTVYYSSLSIRQQRKSNRALLIPEIKLHANSAEPTLKATFRNVGKYVATDIIINYFIIDESLSKVIEELSVCNINALAPQLIYESDISEIDKNRIDSNYYLIIELIYSDRVIDKLFIDSYGYRSFAIRGKEHRHLEKSLEFASPFEKSIIMKRLKQHSNSTKLEITYE